MNVKSGKKIIEYKIKICHKYFTIPEGTSFLNIRFYKVEDMCNRLTTYWLLYKMVNARLSQNGECSR